MEPAPRILIVDDEPSVRKLLRLSLQAEGFDVLEAATAEAAITLVHSAPPDVMILDLGLPDFDGQQVIRDVRLVSDMPILVLSGRTEDGEKIAAIERGADDYMQKPFAMSDLVLRVKAALRQRETREALLDTEHVQTGMLDIHLDSHEVLRGAARIDLDDEEYALLRLLALHGGRVLTYGRLERALWGEDKDTEHHRHLQQRIGALRRKLEAEPSFPRYIVTEPAVGYRLEMLPAEERAA
ncbi:MAG TPA: response regulator transcription factor [Alphaproteobacteria bacterium]|nr:response regulator transcription factor [Alphaproteobacteria bacterium]